MIGADLNEAYLDYVDLSRADLRRAYLGHVDLSGATLNLDGADLRDPRVTKDETLPHVVEQPKYAHHFSHANYDSEEYTVAYIQHSKSVRIVGILPVLILIGLIISIPVFSFSFTPYIALALVLIVLIMLFIGLIIFSYVRDFVILTNKRMIYNDNEIEYKNVRDIRVSNALQQLLEMAQAGSARWHFLNTVRNVLQQLLEMGNLQIEQTDSVPDFIFSNIDHCQLSQNEIFRIKDYDEKEREGKVVAIPVEGDEPIRNRSMTAKTPKAKLEAENTTFQAEPKNK